MKREEIEKMVPFELGSMRGEDGNLYNCEVVIGFLLTENKRLEEEVSELQIENDSLHIVKDEMGRRNGQLEKQVAELEAKNKDLGRRVYLLKQEGE
jgi:phage shock protein A